MFKTIDFQRHLCEQESPMSRLSLGNTTVPDTFPSLFRQVVQPWRMNNNLLGA
jgi:hypothetical protein